MNNHEPEPMAPAALRAGGNSTVLPSPAELLRYLDVVLMLIAIPVALALGVPTLGLLVAAGAWLLQRVLAHTDRRWIARNRAPGSRLGLDVAESFGRIWLLAGAIVVAGAVGNRSDGLAAALTIFAAYSVVFGTRMLSGREGFER
jgi:hypothetical protein